MDTARTLHDLLFTFMSLFHEKFMVKFRQTSEDSPCIKKNHGKILKLLYHYDQLTLTEIAKRLDIEKGSLTTLIDQLEESNLVVRSDDPHDRRKFLVTLSPQGKDEMDQFFHDYSLKLNPLLEKFSPAEVKDFFLNLQSAIDFMKKV